MIFRWLRHRRRSRLADREFPAAWDDILHRNVAHFRYLGDSEQSLLRGRINVFVAEKNWEGCGGLDMTDEVRVTVAAQACLMTLHLNDPLYDHVLSILVYPSAYVARDSRTTGAGVEVESGAVRLGEAWWRGPVILSWDDVRSDGRIHNDGRNLVFHEFAHQLDMMNGRIVDGVPVLTDSDQHTRWMEVLAPVYEELCDDCRHRRIPIIDCYGAQDAGEFFAVLTEAFFESPQRLIDRNPDVYSVLRDFYRHDPVRWSRNTPFTGG